jgi:hypothetical protein
MMIELVFMMIYTDKFYVVIAPIFLTIIPMFTKISPLKGEI